MSQISDWLYSDDRLELRERTLSTLLRQFGSALNHEGVPVYGTESIYACAHDWVSQGNSTPDGVIDYYLENYSGTRNSDPAHAGGNQETSGKDWW